MLTPLGAMSIAIDEAKKGLGFVSPNPPVGCVVLSKEGDLLAKGHHRIYGGDHAEVDAITQIKNINLLDGATVFVTLEPCAHEGKTPSCAKALAKLPLKKIVYGLLDPHPLVSGQGLEILKNANIEVEQFDVLQIELNELAEVFLWNQNKKLPFVSVKVATSLDGQIAHASGASKWITGEESREHAHFLRAIHDATLVGVGTFIQDDPSLNIRHSKFIGKKNRVVVVDPKGEGLKRIEKSSLFKSHMAEDLYWITDKNLKIFGKQNCQVIPCEIDEAGRIVWDELLISIKSKGIESILVEGGAKIISSLLNENKAQRYYQFIAPVIIGAKSGLSFTNEVSHATLPERQELTHSRIISFGRDLMITGRLDDFI